MTEKPKKSFLRRHAINILLVIALIYVWFRPPAWVSEQATPAPSAPVQLVDGQLISLADLKGRVVLVNFWATWCPYCRHEMPDMQRFHQQWQARGFETLAVSVEDDPQKVADFMRKEGYTFPAALVNAEFAAGFGEISQVPMSFIVDRDGVIRHKIKGQVHYARLEDLVEPLLAD
jgi:peroxiredoxin